MLGFYLTLLDTAEEKSKFEQLYIKYRSVMYNYAYSILKDNYLAEDAVHNAFMSLTHNLEKVNDVNCNETRNFLIIIVRNASLKIYNHYKKNISSDDIDIEDLDNTIKITERDYDLKRIYDAILNLNENYSDVLMLKFFYECSNKEIAQLLNITEENAAVRIFRGRNKLKEMLMEEYADE
ncbi:MAG: RNA polymerase sigma factor [Porcipelethomonas sp.]